MNPNLNVRFSKSRVAPEYQTAGGTWKPELHFAGATIDPVEMRWLVDLIRRHEAGVVAHFIFFPLPRVYRIELQFGEGDEDRRLLRACRSEYLASFDEKADLKPSIRRRFQ